jgi:hypothetical protein
VAGSYSRNKGRRLEQEIVNLLKEKKIDAKRISMVETGRIIKGDILVNNEWHCEVKGGSQVPKFLYKATKDGEKVLFSRRDRKHWIVSMDFEWFAKVLQKAIKADSMEELEEELEEEN